MTADGINPLPDRVEAIKQHPHPMNTKELQNFSGAIKFMPRATRTLAPLTQVLWGSPSPRTPVERDREKTAAFQAAKKALQKVNNLAFPRERAKLDVMVDMSVAHVENGPATAT